jgi:hypothetical protein
LQPSFQRWDISVGVATGYKLDSWGSIPGRGKKFLALHSPQTGSGVDPAAYQMGSAGSFLGVKATEA